MALLAQERFSNSPHFNQQVQPQPNHGYNQSPLAQNNAWTVQQTE